MVVEGESNAQCQVCWRRVRDAWESQETSTRELINEFTDSSWTRGNKYHRGGNSPSRGEKGKRIWKERSLWLRVWPLPLTQSSSFAFGPACVSSLFPAKVSSSFPQCFKIHPPAPTHSLLNLPQLYQTGYNLAEYLPAPLLPVPASLASGLHILSGEPPANYSPWWVFFLLTFLLHFFLLLNLWNENIITFLPAFLISSCCVITCAVFVTSEAVSTTCSLAVCLPLSALLPQW